jgi:magnesium transporter
VIVDCAAYESGGRVSDRLSLDEVPAWLNKPGVFVWLGLRMPDHDEMERVCEVFQAGECDVDDILVPHHRPVLTKNPEFTRLVLRTATYDDKQEHVALGELTIMVCERWIITVRYGQASPMTGLRRELEEERTQLAQGPLAVFAAIVTQVIQDYGPALDGFEQDAVEVERDVFDEDVVQTPIRRLYQLKREIRELLVAMEAVNEPLRRLARSRRRPLHPEIAEDVDEALDQLNRAVRRAESLSDLLTSALAASLSELSLRQNEDMRRITAWVAIAAIPTVVGAIYGMNFEHMPELSWRYGYPLIMLLTGVACLVLHRVFRRSGWL